MVKEKLLWRGLSSKRVSSARQGFWVGRNPMPRFLIRVELRNIRNLEDDAYDKLHEAMEVEHCYRSLGLE